MPNEEEVIIDPTDEETIDPNNPKTPPTKD